MNDTIPDPPDAMSDLHSRLAQDLELLMNTRSVLSQAPVMEGYPLAQDSFLTYGLPDFTGCSPGHPTDRNRLQTSVLQALRRFEPRLTQIQVHLEPAKPGRPLTLFIEGRLTPHPQHPRLRFQVDFQPWSGTCEVRR